MALRFYGSFRNIRDELYKIEIHDSTYSNAPHEFTLRGSGFDLSYNGGKETYQLIKSSTLTFVINIDRAVLKVLPSEIASTTDIGRFGVKLFKDDTFNGSKPDGSNYNLYWLGCINKRIMSIEDAAYPFDFKVSAVDGIELLKNYTYNNSSSNYVFEDRLSVVQFLTKIIDKADFANNIATTQDILATRINWYETNHNLGDSVAANTYMYETVFNTVQNGSSTLSTYYDVLKHICDIFQCRFMLYEGKFWYTQFSLLERTQNTYYIYKLNNSAGTPASITKLANEIYGERGGIYDTGKKDTEGQVLDNPNFTTNLNDWNVFPSGTVVWVSNGGIGGANFTGSPFGFLQQTFAVTTNTDYQVEITVTGRTTGYFYLSIGGTVTPNNIGNGTFTYNVTTGSTQTGVTIFGLNNFNGTVSSITATRVATTRPGFFNRTKTFGEKISSVKIKWNGLSDDAQNLYPLTYFPVWQQPNSGWVPYGQNSNGPNLSGFFQSSDNINFRLTFKFSIRITRNQVNTSTSFFGRVIIPFWFLAKDNTNVFPNYRWWRGNGLGSGTGVVLPVEQDTGFTSAGNWVNQTGAINNATIFKTSSINIPQSAAAGTEDVFHFDITLITDMVPVSSVQGVFLYNDYSGSWDNNLSGGDWFAIENPLTNAISSADDFDGFEIIPQFEEITIAPYQDGEPFLGSTVDSYVSEDASDSNNPEELFIDTIKWGDGPNAVGIRTIWVFDGSNLIQSNLWQINNTGTTFKIHKLITDTILDYNYFSGERLDATIYQSPNLTASQRINISEGFDRQYIDEDGNLVTSEVYGFSSLSFNPEMSSWTFKGKQLNQPAPAITSEEPTETDQITLEGKPYNNISNSINSLQGLDSTALLNQVLVPGTSTTSITVSGIKEDLSSSTVLLIQSSSSKRLWEKITLSSSASKGATTLSINAFTPTYSYDTSSRIIISRGSLMTSGGGSSSDVIQVLLKDFNSYLFYMFHNNNWYSAGSATLAVLGNSSSPGNISAQNSEFQSRVACYTATQSCTVQRLTFTFYWSSSVISSAVDIEFAFSKFNPNTNGTQSTISMNSITATNNNGSYTEALPYQKTFTFSGSNANLSAGDAFAFHMRTTSGQSSQRILVYATAVLEIVKSSGGGATP